MIRLSSPLVQFAPQAAALLLALTLTACGGKPNVEAPPPTFAVTGKVVDRGGHPVSVGLITFQSQTSQQWLADASLKPDGTFTLETLVDGKRIPGAIAGPHEVTFIPPMTAAQTEVPVALSKPITIEPRDGQDFLIDLGKQ